MYRCTGKNDKQVVPARLRQWHIFGGFYGHTIAAWCFSHVICLQNFRDNKGKYAASFSGRAYSVKQTYQFSLSIRFNRKKALRCFCLHGACGALPRTPPKGNDSPLETRNKGFSRVSTSVARCPLPGRLLPAYPAPG